MGYWIENQDGDLMGDFASISGLREFRGWAQLQGGAVAAFIGSGLSEDPAAVAAQLKGCTEDGDIGEMCAELARIAEHCDVAMVLTDGTSGDDDGEETDQEASAGDEMTADDRAKWAKTHEAMPDGCLAYETMVATQHGPRQIGSMVGWQTLLTDLGWRQAEIRCFGVRPLLEVRFRRGEQDGSVLTTAAHRWLLGDGRWVTTDGLSKVLNDGCAADRIDPPCRPVAPVTEESADASGDVVVVNMESGPFASRARVSAPSRREFATEGASPALLLGDASEVGVADAVLTQENAIAAPEPSGVPDAYSRGAFGGATEDAKAAVGPAPLVPNIEIGMWPIDATEAAGNGSDEVNRDTTGVFGSGRAHTADTTLSSWRVLSVVETDRVEPVYCAVVPGLHRFVLANGILTGNSFPIRDAHAVTDLKNAIQAIGRAKDRAAVERHIRKRAKETGHEDLLPDWAQAAGAEPAVKPAGYTTADTPPSYKDGWHAVDLDGTIATHTSNGSVGKPIPAMVERVKKLLAAGKDVRIFTARKFDTPETRQAIESFCSEHLGKVLPITNVKHPGMRAFYDDRAVSVVMNKGSLRHRLTEKMRGTQESRAFAETMIAILWGGE